MDILNQLIKIILIVMVMILFFQLGWYCKACLDNPENRRVVDIILHGGNFYAAAEDNKHIVSINHHVSVFRSWVFVQ